MVRKPSLSLIHQYFTLYQLCNPLSYNRHSSTKELKEGEMVEFTVASFQHANGVIHIEGALA